MSRIYTFTVLFVSLILLAGQEVLSRPQEESSPRQGIHRLPDDTIQPIPFTETWDSASFTANGWRFPWMQGNWTILTSDGNPAPCAAFTGTPSQSNYIYALVSPWFDATDLTCDKIFLDFDLRLTSLQNTGTEQLTIILETDTLDITLEILANDTSYSWEQRHYHLSRVAGKYFRIKFIASGALAGRITQWELDNFSIIRKCMPPQLVDCFPNGHCGVDERTCIISLSWSPPDCSQTTEEHWLVFDDDTWEDGLRIAPGVITWIGNLFPVDPGFCGTMERIDLYFVDNGTGSPQNFTVELFNASGISLGSSVPFVGMAPDFWIAVPLGIPFCGPVYAMVKYNSLPGLGYYLACDTGGPFTAQKLAYQYDGTTWANPVYWPDGAVFLVRGLAIVESDNIEERRVMTTPKGVTGEQDPGPYGLEHLGTHDPVNATEWHQYTIKNDADSSTLIGYNIYRKEDYQVNDTAFFKINDELVLDTAYLDSVYCGAEYYLTAVYSNGCESDPSGFTFGGCDLGIPEEPAIFHLQVAPNPADRWLELTCDAGMEEVSLYDLTGRVRHRKEAAGTFTLRMELPWLPDGLYLLKVITEKGTSASRVMILHGSGIK